ncbi:ABC transporter G family member 23 [Tetranychus urticae]|uniref:Uncharacterized protein n=1 Tax=Tetranychus urticae TaxID=32264 RepID=T1L3L0_TETUR|nr:ABC transporter G family member 23 [Tetranychus urticae]
MSLEINNNNDQDDNNNQSNGRIEINRIEKEFNYDPNNNNNEPKIQDDHHNLNHKTIHSDSLYYPDPIRSWLNEDANLAVRVRNVCLTYGSGQKTTCVLNNLSISVPVGSIYGLLGPSGCGKTSLLGVISGLFRPESGLVRVYGSPPGTQGSGVPDSGLGYMPQDTSLHTDLTIYENLWYFGRLFFLPPAVLNKRIDFLVTLLEMPEPNRLVSTLSGGQQRRVSLACAIIHKPRLAILDEPTCGVDPVLCHKIWQLLNKFSKEDKMTIIITTHYIEECRKASMVGFMRAGEVLEEDTPSNLTARYQTPKLEEIFYKICFSQKRRNTILSRRMSTQSPTLAPDDKQRDYVSPYKSYRSTYPIHSFFSSIYTLTWRYMLQSLRSPVYLLLLFIFPVSSLVIMDICVGRSPFDVPVGWVVADTPDYLGSHVKEENFSEAFFTHQVPYYPDVLYNAIDHHVLDIIKYPNLDDALADVRNGKLTSVLHMKQHFSTAFHERADMFSGKDVDNATISRGTIWLYADFVDKFMVTTVSASVEFALLKVFNVTAPAYNLTYHQRALPVQLGEIDEGGLANIYEINLSSFLVPGLIIASTFACSFAISSLALIAEVEDKIFVRNFSAGLTSSQIIFSQLISRFIFFSINGVVFLAVSVYLLGIPCRSTPIIPILIIWVQVIAGCSAGVFFGAAFPKFESALYVSLFTFGLVTAFSGLFWPPEAIPYYMKTFSFLSPFTESVVALRKVMAQFGISFSKVVLPGMITSICWITFFDVGAIYILKRRKFST